jgi:Fur family ferric uptake transcriptional regulator
MARQDGTADDDVTVRALRAAGLAVTGPRRAVYQLLAGRERPASAADIHDLLRTSGSRLGLTSVYRVLRAFTASGIVHVFAGDEQRFRICDRSPHAHLVCEECGRVIERPADTVRQWLAPAARDADFVPNVERSDVYGRCGQCRPETILSLTDLPLADADAPGDRATRRARLDGANENGYQNR